MPTFAVGDRFLIPVLAHQGTPGYLPFFLYGTGAFYRLYDDDQGGVVLTPEGQIIQQMGSGTPIPGTVVPSGISHEPGGVPGGAAAEHVLPAVQTYRATVGFDGVTPPEGDWVGRVHIRSEGEVKVAGIGTYDTAGECTAHVKGVLQAGVLELNGWCNAPQVGRLDVQIIGNRANGAWRGLMEIGSALDPNLAVQFTWHDEPWSSVRDHPDSFTAHATQARLAPTAEYDVTVQQTPARGVEFIAGWNGWRAPMTIASFKQWLEQQASIQGNAGQAVRSLPNVPANCVRWPIAPASYDGE